MAKPIRNSKTATSKRFRWMAWSFAFILFCAMALPMTGYLFPESQTAVQAQQTGSDANQRSEFWRVVREGGGGYSAVIGNDVNIETNMLYNTTGQNWRELRNGLIANYGGWFLFLTIVAILLFYSMRGRVDLTEPASGKRVKRWTGLERTLHWYTAILFICLAISGLSLLFGRALLIPLFGPQNYALWASFSINIHNTLGPFFAIGPILMFLCWVRHNMPKKVDIVWMMQGGGIIGSKHPSAGKANAGEKIWFWIVMLIGLGAVCISGFALIGWVQDYFGVADTRELAQIMHVIHAISAILWIAIFIGHAYIGTIGSEGSIDAMSKGHVSVEWAKQHHDIWYEQVKDTHEVEGESETGTASTGESTA